MESGTRETGKGLALPFLAVDAETSPTESKSGSPNQQQEVRVGYDSRGTASGSGAYRPQVAKPPPPHDLALETALLSAILQDTKGAEEVYPIVHADDFYDPGNRLIFAAIHSLYEKGLPITVLSVASRLKDTGQLRAAGGNTRLTELGTQAMFPAKAKALVEYATTVSDKSRLRRALSLCEAASARLYEPISDPKAFLDDLEQGMFEIGRAYRGVGRSESAVDILDAAAKSLQDAFSSEGGTTGIPSGLRAFDGLLGGLHRGDQVVIGGRPGMAKSSLALSLAKNVAEDGYGVLFLSLEMPRVQLGTRLICMDSGLSIGDLRSLKLTEMEQDAFQSSKNRLKEKLGCLWIDDTSGLTPVDVRSKVRRAAVESERRSRQKSIGLVVVDYLQLMRMPRASSRELEVSEISRSLKDIAKEFDCPMVVLSQLNRSCEMRPDKRPLLSDLRESGSIEQDADAVCFLYRQSYYDSSNDPVAEVIVAKQRNGPTGTFQLKFEASSTKFSDLDEEQFH